MLLLVCSKTNFEGFQRDIKRN